MQINAINSFHMSNAPPPYSIKSKYAPPAYSIKSKYPNHMSNAPAAHSTKSKYRLHSIKVNIVINNQYRIRSTVSSLNPTYSSEFPNNPNPLQHHPYSPPLIIHSNPNLRCTFLPASASFACLTHSDERLLLTSRFGTALAAVEFPTLFEGVVEFVNIFVGGVWSGPRDLRLRDESGFNFALLEKCVLFPPT